MNFSYFGSVRCVGLPQVMAATHKGLLVLNVCVRVCVRTFKVWCVYGCQNEGALLLITSGCIVTAAVKQL